MASATAATSGAVARGSATNSSSRLSRLVPSISFMLKKWWPPAADLVDRDDLRMVELRDGLGLVLEAEHLGLRGELPVRISLSATGRLSATWCAW